MESGEAWRRLKVTFPEDIARHSFVGALLAWIFFDGHTTSVMSGSGAPTQLAFAFAVTRERIVVGIAWALLIGLVGGLVPAISAARLPVATALRAAAA
jgi:putative ABC transport system permease protein